MEQKALRFSHPDLHLHSVFSDGTDDLPALLSRVKEAGVDVFALTDHDTMDGCGAMRKLLKPGDPFFIGGIELNCSDEKGKYHILGYCYDESKTSIVKAVSKNHKARFDKVAHRLKHLEREYGIVFSPTELHRIYENENPGKPVIVALMREKGLIKDDKTGFEMLSCPIPEAEALTPEEAIDAILEADGIPVLAHGILADGDTHLSEEALTERVARLKRAGLMGLEAYYSAFSQEDITVTLALARTYGLMVTAGSDYHGVGKHGGVLPGQTHSPSPDEMNRFYRAVEKLLL